MPWPLPWLSEYVDRTVPPEELARRLTPEGVEVGEIIRSGEGGAEIRVARVVSVERHPNADRLTLPTVDLGNGEQHTVVCGAPNVAPGPKGGFAPGGAQITEG